MLNWKETENVHFIFESSEWNTLISEGSGKWWGILWYQGPLTLKYVSMGFLCVDRETEGRYTRRREKGR